jgi:hypothetical protein
MSSGELPALLCLQQEMIVRLNQGRRVENVLKEAKAEF